MLGVNLSIRQLGRRDLVETVGAALERSGVPPAALCFEVTESCMAGDPEGAVAALRDLKALGVALALDDFGTGYSSLSALSSYPLDYVKIDRSFIQRVAEDAGASRMFAAVLGVARAAELQAVAEGIEQERQLHLVRRLGCEFGQGFVFARPLSAEGLLERLGDGADRPAGSQAAA